MRKVILGFGMSLDGYLARPDGSVDFLVMDQDTRKLMAAFFRTIDTAIMGRKTAEMSLKMTGDSGERIPIGGGELGRSFLEADKVDELSLGFVPVLLGEGIPAFPGGFPQRDFTLAECKTYSKHGVALTYRRVRKKK
jgi:dihydrofolate reductase